MGMSKLTAWFYLSLVLLQAEAAGPEYCLDGVAQRGVRCIITAGAMRGLPTKCGAPLFPFSGNGEPSAGAARSETQGHAHALKGLFGRHEKALYPLLHPWVRERNVFLPFLQPECYSRRHNVACFPLIIYLLF